MGKIDIGRAFGPAWEHMMNVLFRPFRLKMWLALGFVAIFAGSVMNSGGGGFNFPGSSGSGGGAPSSPNPFDSFDPAAWFREYWPFVALGIVLLLGLWILFVWISSVMRFVYIDQISRKSMEIKEPFSRLKRPGTSLFVWQLIIFFAILLGLAIFVAIPVALLYPLFNNNTSGASFALLIGLGVVLLFLAMFLIGVLLSLILRFVPIVMYASRVDFVGGWKILYPILRQNLGQMVLYLLLQIGFAIGAGIYAGLALLAVAIVFAIPGGILFGIGYAIYNSTGGWNAIMISYAAIFGTLFSLASGYAMSIAMQPACVYLMCFDFAVIGQVDPGLAVIPIPPPPPSVRYYGQVPPPPPPSEIPPETPPETQG